MAQSRASELAGDVGQQLADLKDTIADLGAQVSSIAQSRGREARRGARSAAKSMGASGGRLYDDGADALGVAGDHALYYGRRASRAMRENPGLSTLGVLVGVGVIAAIIYAAQQDDDHRWYDRRRGGWF